jgi:hypothetical protein
VGDGRARIPLQTVLTEVIVGQRMEPRKNKRTQVPSFVKARSAETASKPKLARLPQYLLENRY